MRDVARLADASLATVSRVVNGTGDVRADLAARVSEAIELLGYRPDLTASALRRADGRSRSIGVILEDVSNPFLAAVQRGIEEAARDRGVIAFVGSSDRVAEREVELAGALAARGVDGLIIVPSAPDQTYLARDRDNGVALVFADRPPRQLDGDTVVADNFGGAVMAVDHVATAGHRRIAFLGDRHSVYTTRERLRGYRHALRGRGVMADPRFERLDLDTSGAASAAVHALLAAKIRPTALFASQNLVAIGAVRALRELAAEHEVAVVGFDDIPLGALLEPGMTVIAQDPRAIGRRAADLLFTRIDGYSGPPRRVVVPVSLITRGSGEIAAAARGGVSG
jgi:LacI family transcriptional regulator